MAGRRRSSLLASSTGGTYYYALSGDQLAGFYTAIAGALRQDAGVNTTMNLSFSNIVVNNVPTPGNAVYNYRHIDGHSTQVTSFNRTVNPFPGYPKNTDSTAMWNANKRIDFTIGTIRLNQTWQATVTFEVLKEGNINVLDASSKITTENSPKPLKIPDAFITVIPNRLRRLLRDRNPPYPEPEPDELPA